MVDPERCYFRKQFLIVPQDLAAIHEKPLLSGWRRTRFGDDLLVFHHPDLAVTRATVDRNDVLCLGILLDSADPAADNDAIARALCIGCEDFRDLEKRLAALAGRWVVMAKLNGRAFLYHDAGGLKSVFLYGSRHFGTCVASQPALFERLFGLKRVRERDAEMKRIGALQWPVHVYPYDDVAQLLPNHRLNLSSYEMERYWPRDALPRIDVEDAASQILARINRIMLAAVHRARCFVGLTGGYDSRLLLAAGKSLRDDITYFTVRAPITPRHDLVIPERLARIAGMRYERADFIDCDPALLDILRTNSSGLSMQPRRPNVRTLAAVIGEGMQLPAAAAEVMRCFYYKDGAHPPVSVDELARRTGFAASAMARQGFAEWIKRLPDSDVSPLDLFYWEHRLGVWASASYTFKEALVDSCPPLNCRRLLEIGLGVDVKDRRLPYNLFRRMYSLADARLLNPPFNDTVRERLSDRLRRLPLVWRLARSLR